MLHALVYPCLEVGTLSKFTAALKALDPTLESFQRELSAASDHFMNRKMYNVAYVFQDLLQVLRSIMIFVLLELSVCIQNLHFAGICVSIFRPLEI